MFSKKQNKIDAVVDTALKNLNSLIDVNTVVGQSVLTKDGDCIIPVSKVTLGVLSGGGEYGKTGIFKTSDNFPFSAGNGAIVSIKPTAFLIKEKGKKYKVLYADEKPYVKLLDKTVDILNGTTKNEVKNES